MRKWPVGLAVWLALSVVAQAAALHAVVHFFVRTARGQGLDTMVLAANRIGQARIDEVVTTILTVVSTASLVAATVMVGFIAVARRRFAVAVAALLLIGGANVTTQLLKAVLTRPYLGIDSERAAAGNSLPSGHVTVAASVAVAFILVLPAQVRGIAAVLGAIGTSAVGVATLSAGWHRPSDAVAALLVVGGWAGVAGLYTVLAQRRYGTLDHGPRNRTATVLLAGAGFLFLIAAAVAVKLSDDALLTPVDELSRNRLLVAYAGAAAAIAGFTGLILASVVATVHRVVPEAVPGPNAPARVA